MNKKTPRSLGYRFPAEFEPHLATWLSWPHNDTTWPGKINSIFTSYAAFIKKLTEGELVRINVADQVMKNFASNLLVIHGVNLDKVEFYFHPTNDAWCRDHGPAFLVKPGAIEPKAVVDWDFNAWGGKYPPFDLDNAVPALIAKALGLPVFYPGIIMEGGSVDFNGAGTVITSSCVLLNENRNPHLNQTQVEKCLMDYYGQDQVLWVNEGVVGDDTDGHIDDTVRFINEDTVIAVVEERKGDENYSLLQKNLADLKKMRLLNGKQLNIIEIPMPDDVIWEGRRLPASYANFYIANKSVIVPTFRTPKDDKVLSVIADCFPEREVVGIDSTDIIWGFGSFHCLSQQEPV
jgi:agmatine deiminase